MKRSKPLKRGKPLARSSLKSKRPAGGFPESVRLAARARSNGICEAGSSECNGKATEFHHRKLRRFKDHTLANCLHVCLPCHRHFHDNVQLAMSMGWIVAGWDDPVERLPMKGDRWSEYHRPQR